MKTKNAFSKIGFFVLLLSAMAIFLTNCVKDESIAEMAKQGPDAQFVTIPADIAMYLTDEEEAEFYASKPNYVPGYGSLEAREAGEWHPFFAAGKVDGAKYPVLNNCDNPPIASICPSIDAPGFEINPDPNDLTNVVNMCSDPSQYVGYAALWSGNVNVAGYGAMKQFYSDFACGVGTAVENGWHNGSFKTGSSSLHWRPFDAAYTVSANEDGTVSVDSRISICNPLRPEKMCWAYSTGDFKNVTGDGTINWRWTGNPANFTTQLFEPFATAHMMAWGWLYY